MSDHRDFFRRELDRQAREVGRRIAEEIDRKIMEEFMKGSKKKLKPICPTCGSDNVVEVRAGGERLLYCGSCKAKF